MKAPQKILVAQTAFIGDAILATGILEKLHKTYPDSQIDYLVRKGNDSLFKSHPFINKLLVWNKQEGKYKNLIKLLKEIRADKYDYVVNVQRFANSGFLTTFSKAKVKIGFNKNPWSWAFDKKVPHDVNNGLHEVERNQLLIESIAPGIAEKPKLYPSDADFAKVEPLKVEKYICLAPASVWFTKQLPKKKWIELISKIPSGIKIYLLGAPSDKSLCEEIINAADYQSVVNLCGELNLLQSAALMKDAQMNYVNDSAPMHLASSMNASTAAIFCSTIPEFGFGPLSNDSHVIQIEENLSCRPCGLHGKKACPQEHFDCGFKMDTTKMADLLKVNA